jgi:hypothetical protein
MATMAMVRAQKNKNKNQNQSFGKNETLEAFSKSHNSILKVTTQPKLVSF